MSGTIRQVIVAAQWLVLAAGSCAAGAVPSFAQAQSFPNHTVKIIVPAAPGGALDAIARLTAPNVSEAWGQPVIIENKPGANWIIGMDYVAKSPADGYTLLMVADSGITINPHVFPRMPLDPLAELVPVIATTSTPFVLLANPQLPAKTQAELIAYMKANPGKLNHGSNSSTTMLISELFKSRAGVEYVDVNFRGAAESIVATMANTTQLCFVDLGSGSSPIDGKTLNPIGLTSGTRYKLRPELPTIAEQGLPGFSVGSTTVLLAPAKTPPEIVQKINAAFTQSLKSPDVVAKLTTMGQAIEAGASDTTQAELVRQSKQWQTLIKERNIQFGQR